MFILISHVLRYNLKKKKNTPSIQKDAQSCVSGCGVIESADHLFLHCDVFGQVWQLVHLWLGVSSVNPLTISDHYLQFGISLGIAKSRCSFMYLIWFASTWVIWKERNARIFCAKENIPSQLLENIKLLSFSSFKAYYVTSYYSFHDWCQNPFNCLGIG
jgi:hypothetical protein